MLRFQVFHRGLILGILLQDEVDEAKTLEIVVNQHILVLLLEVVGNKVLIDFQAFVERIICSAQVGLHEIFGG